MFFLWNILGDDKKDEVVPVRAIRWSVTLLALCEGETAVDMDSYGGSFSIYEKLTQQTGTQQHCHSVDVQVNIGSCPSMAL